MSGQVPKGLWVALAVAAVVVALVVVRGGGPDTALPLTGSGLSNVMPDGPQGTGTLRNEPLPGGGFSDGDRCGSKGYHYFSAPPASHPAAAVSPSGIPVPGPQLALSSYGGGADLAGKHWQFSISFGIAAGSSGTLDLAPPLGAQGVAVEIEGPHGLVAGGHGLPVQLDGVTVGADHRVHVRPGEPVTAEVTLPLAAVCPGVDAGQVVKGLSPPIDSEDTITGQPPCTLVVSIADPSVGALRAAVHAPVGGDTLSGDNRVR